jgi:hypothetical protein
VRLGDHAQCDLPELAPVGPARGVRKAPLADTAEPGLPLVGRRQLERDTNKP